jgi:hypothetical protein
MPAGNRRSADHITLAMTQAHRKAPDAGIMRRALLSYAFNAASTSRPVPNEVTGALEWIGGAAAAVPTWPVQRGLRAGAGPVPRLGRGLSSTVITRLTGTWQDEQRAFAGRDLSGMDCVYLWVDGST